MTCGELRYSAAIPGWVGASAGFGNEPANLNYYYKFYEGYKKDPGAEDEDEDTTK